MREAKEAIPYFGDVTVMVGGFESTLNQASLIVLLLPAASWWEVHVAEVSQGSRGDPSQRVRREST